ncbi:hypothetical protein [Scleromatobacter humisilvae]|uniref:Intracellular proteinase inhibitor BsuPI domain-containing protein n=1 Tax=Scleromatobacter humisilvae TaxID=2897159 RepID=A0A9X1YN87_9BURK|nr:hypothetical protein [Scleromatobacter humisilvae]MCK9688090.1 hypothetical protein [Scleromatobacter humisilvae]
MNSTTNLPLRRRGLLASGALAALLATVGLPACADSRLVQVDVVDRDDGQVLHVWRDHGRPVVAGRPGARYAVRLANTTGQRVLAVVAIDGVNVISGETAGVGQRGYVLEPWQRAEITGWRKSDSEVAAFEFTALPDSYAARTGRPNDVGVIGVAVFREAPQVALSAAPPVMPRPRIDGMAKAAQEPGDARDAAGEVARSAAPAMRAAPQPSERLGTGHGERETSVARTTTFDRATAQPEQTVAIRYDSLDNLVAAGIVPPPHVATTSPRPFPADPSPGYVPDPPRR